MPIDLIMLCMTWWTRSMIEFAWGLRVVIILRLIPYSFLRVSRTSAANSLPLSMTTSVGHGYRVNQVNSSRLAISSAAFMSTWVISNHPVAGSIMVRQWSCVSCLPFPILYGPMRSMHKVCHGTTSGAGLGGSFPYFCCVPLAVCKCCRPYTLS